ncbi:MAG: hypothetical protein JOZ07_08060 [Solirubrobacterales bacterium]|nr:hypothetical protein [Solirubrobacterales bacterium]
MRWLLAVVAVGVIAGGVAIAALGAGHDASAPTRDPAPAVVHVIQPGPGTVTVALPGGDGRPVPDGFLGLSMEFQAVRAYTGSNARAVNPVLEQLIRNLSPGQAPRLRIGGDSTDVAYPEGMPPPYIGYGLTPSWMATTAALAHDLGARMTIGVNLAADEPALAAAQARAYLRAMGRRTLAGLEIGNEPNVYGELTRYRTPSGRLYPARPPGFGYRAFRSEFRAIAAQLPSGVSLAGPGLAVGPTPGPGSWVQTLPDFLAADPRVRTMTLHRYPLRNCFVPPSDPQYPTLSHLLAPYATSGLASSLGRWIAIAHHAHRLLRVDELNSVACRGRNGVSDTFATSLWAVDALFSLLDVGVDGVNLHTLPSSPYELFQFSRAQGRWRAWVRPLYYGLQLFAAAAPRGSQLLTLPPVVHDASLSLWATRGTDRRTRVVLINKSRFRGETISLRPPAGVGGEATIERLQAPHADATADVSLGGGSYGRETYTGRLPAPELQPLVADSADRYTLRLAPASAALVTFPAG